MDVELSLSGNQSNLDISSIDTTSSVSIELLGSQAIIPSAQYANGYFEEDYTDTDINATQDAIVALNSTAIIGEVDSVSPLDKTIEIAGSEFSVIAGLVTTSQTVSLELSPVASNIIANDLTTNQIVNNSLSGISGTSFINDLFANSAVDIILSSSSSTVSANSVSTSQTVDVALSNNSITNATGNTSTISEVQILLNGNSTTVTTGIVLENENAIIALTGNAITSQIGSTSLTISIPISTNRTNLFTGQLLTNASAAASITGINILASVGNIIKETPNAAPIINNANAILVNYSNISNELVNQNNLLIKNLDVLKTQSYIDYAVTNRVNTIDALVMDVNVNNIDAAVAIVEINEFIANNSTELPPETTNSLLALISKIQVSETETIAIVTQSNTNVNNATVALNNIPRGSVKQSNGLGVARLSDICSGHSPWPPRSNVTASTNVFINGLGAHRVTDTWETHCAPPGCHDSTLATGSLTVFVNGLALGRVGDTIECGSTVATGSDNVFAG